MFVNTRLAAAAAAARGAPAKAQKPPQIALHKPSSTSSAIHTKRNTPPRGVAGVKALHIDNDVRNSNFDE